MREAVRKLLIPVALAALAAAAVEAQPAHPDLSGYWVISFGALPPRRAATPLERSLLDRLAPGTLLLADSGLVEFPPGDYGGLKAHAAALEAARGYDPDVQRSVATTCRPPDVIYSMQGPFPIEIFQGTELVVIKMEYYDQVRIVFMNQSTHPDDWPNSLLGHSIGRWEGDTLVVDTTHIQAATLFNNGLDHGAGIHLIERFRSSEDRKTLVITQEFEDPETFDGHAARLLSLARGNDHVYPYDCDPSYGIAIATREKE